MVRRQIAVQLNATATHRNGPGASWGRCGFRGLPALAALVALATSGVAGAVVDVRFERWEILATAVPRDVVPPVDSTIAISVEFDATATAADRQPGHGLRFALAERDAGAHDVLALFDLVPCAPLPPVGATVAVRAVVDVYCDAGGALRARNGVQWLVNWCDDPQARACNSNGFLAAVRPDASAPEPWEFVVLDENGVEGSFATPDDILECGPVGTFVRDYRAPDTAESGAVGLFADSTATVCSDQVAVLEPFRWYIVARLGGLSRCGLTAIEFGIHDWPAGLLVNATPNPGGIGFGNPLGTGGVAFTCAGGGDDRVVLYTLDGVATEPLADVELHVGAGQPPSNFLWDDPWLELCPQFNGLRRRLRGGTFWVNPTTTRNCVPQTTVVQRTWSAMKSLYRD